MSNVELCSVESRLARRGCCNQSKSATDYFDQHLVLDNHARYQGKCGCAGQPSDYATLPEVRRTTPG